MLPGARLVHTVCTGSTLYGSRQEALADPEAGRPGFLLSSSRRLARLLSGRRSAHPAAALSAGTAARGSSRLIPVAWVDVDHCTGLSLRPMLGGLLRAQTHELDH
jgi:hypothetical protein